jgi:hypothetical protein
MSHGLDKTQDTLLNDVERLYDETLDEGVSDVLVFQVRSLNSAFS